MAKKSPEDLMKQIASRIQATVAPLPDEQEPQVLFCMGVPGVTISESMTDEDIALLVDNIPQISQFWLSSNRRVRDEYATISVAQADSPAADPKLKEAADEARALIDTKVGDKTKFEHYMFYKKEWQAVKQLFDAETSKPKAKRNQDTINELTDELNNKTDEWHIKGFMNEVDDALTAISQYLAGDPKAAFADAAKTIKMLTKKTSGGAPYLPVDCIPDDWVAKSLAENGATVGLSWTKVVLKESEESEKLHKDVSSLSSNSGLSAGGGLWKVGIDVGVSKDTLDINKSSHRSNFVLVMEIARVEIQRPWFNGSLFSLEAHVPGRKKHSISGPKMIPDKNGVQPSFNILPVSLIIARNLVVFNDFSADEQKFHDEKVKVDVDASVSYGPFKLNNKTSSMKATTDEEKTNYGASGALSFKEPQIIGFLCSWNRPAFPEKDAPAAAGFSGDLIPTDSVSDEEIAKFQPYISVLKIVSDSERLVPTDARKKVAKK